MRTEQEIDELCRASYREVERLLDIKIRNGQMVAAIRKAMNWVKEEAGSSSRVKAWGPNDRTQQY